MRSSLIIKALDVKVSSKVVSTSYDEMDNGHVNAWLLNNDKRERRLDRYYNYI
jgi:hypothetical protein